MTTEKYDVIIVGAGASGMMAGIEAAKSNKRVLILEHTAKPGKKILATGNGKCNFTNTHYDEKSYRGENLDIVSKVLDRFDYNNTIEYFRELGVIPRNKNGYIYPNSEQSSTIVDVLLMELYSRKVSIKYNEDVENIIKKDNFFSIVTNKSSYQSKYVVLATGGMASANLGSDGSGYELATNLGHTLIEPVPALVQLVGKGKFFKELAGVRMTANVELVGYGKKDKKIATTRYTENGEILFTKYGLSGIPIMQLSRYAVIMLKRNLKVKITLDLIPDVTEKEMIAFLKNKKLYSNYKDNYSLLIGIFNKKVAGYIARSCEEDDYAAIARMSKEFVIEIIGDNGFDNAQVTAGGIKTTEVNYTTMESKVTKGLYLAGELLDIDGNCGGYNLQWAWATGYIAGKHISSR